MKKIRWLGLGSGILILGFAVGCGSSGSVVTTTTVAATTTTTSVATTTTSGGTTTTSGGGTTTTTTAPVTTTTTTTSTTTTTWDGLYRAQVTMLASNEGHPDQAVMAFVKSGGGFDIADMPTVSYSGGEYSYLFVTNEAAGYCVFALDTIGGSPSYIGGYGTYEGEPMVEWSEITNYLALFTLEAGSRSLTLESYVLYPTRWIYVPTFIYSFESDTGDGVIHDSSGNDPAYDGTGHNVDLVDAGRGASRVASFEGTTSSIEVADLGDGENVSFGTIAFWLNPAADADQVLYDGSGTYPAFKIGLYASGKVFYAHRDYESDENVIITSESGVASGSWTHVAVALGNSTQLRIFINGTLEAADLIENATLSKGTDFKFGCPPADLDNYDAVTGWYNGLMDSVYFYETGLGTDEVRELMEE